MKKTQLFLYALLSIFLFTASNSVFSQTALNVTLIKNLNVRPSQTPSQFGSKYSAIWGWTAPNGREYAIMGCVTGTSFIDITDSANIVEKDFVSGPYSPWREIKVYQNYAYIVVDQNGTGMQIIDLSYLPDSVRLVKTWTFSGYTQAHSISIEGQYLYLNGGNASSNGGIRIVDLADPINPVQRGQYSTRYVHDSYIRNDTIYAAAMFSNRYDIINAANKNSPQLITSFTNLPNFSLTHNCQITDDRRYLFTTDESQTPPGTVKVWNIQNLSNVQYVTSIRPAVPVGNNAIGHNLTIKGNLLVVSHYEAGIRFYNISNPMLPVEIGYYDTYSSADSADYRGNWGHYLNFASGKIISSDMQTGLWVNRLTVAPTGIGENTYTANRFSLSQNYPNPFNPVTKISFTLAKNSAVSIKVFNLAGKEVAELLNDRRDGGKYEVLFDAAKYKLSSGIYFYKLITPDYSEVKKMMLVK
jgi:choice-of-anchor B domain-containing protein